MQELRKRLQLLLDEGMSQREVAAAVGVTETLLSRALKGHSTPSGEDAIKLWEFANNRVRTANDQPRADRADAEDPEVPAQARTGASDPVRPPGPAQFWTNISAEQNKVLLPGDARLLVGWLPRAETSPIDCIGVVNSEGGRRILPRSSAINTRIANLERTLVTAPVRADEFGTDRLRLSRYLAASWLIQISYIAAIGYKIRVISPENALPANVNVDVFASKPEILELFGPSGSATTLDTELRQVAKEFGRLLDQFAES